MRERKKKKKTKTKSNKTYNQKYLSYFRRLTALAGFLHLAMKKLLL